MPMLQDSYHKAFACLCLKPTPLVPALLLLSMGMSALFCVSSCMTFVLEQVLGSPSFTSPHRE